MNSITENNEEKPIEVFTGTAWEVALVESLLENAEIRAYVYYIAPESPILDNL